MTEKKIFVPNLHPVLAAMNPHLTSNPEEALEGIEGAASEVGFIIRFRPRTVSTFSFIQSLTELSKVQLLEYFKSQGYGAQILIPNTPEFQNFVLVGHEVSDSISLLPEYSFDFSNRNPEYFVELMNRLGLKAVIETIPAITLFENDSSIINIYDANESKLLFKVYEDVPNHYEIVSKFEELSEIYPKLSVNEYSSLSDTIANYASKFVLSTGAHESVSVHAIIESNNEIYTVVTDTKDYFSTEPLFYPRKGSKAAKKMNYDLIKYTSPTVLLGRAGEEVFQFIDFEEFSTKIAEVRINTMAEVLELHMETITEDIPFIEKLQKVITNISPYHLQNIVMTNPSFLDEIITVLPSDSDEKTVLQAASTLILGYSTII